MAKVLKHANADAHFHDAEQYHFAAKTLHPHQDTAPQPIYFLFAHTIELSLRAHHLLCGRSVRAGSHFLRPLLDTSRTLGLGVTREMETVVDLLDSESRLQGFRYFAFATTERPELGYLAEEVEKLMALVREEFSTRLAPPSPPGVVGKFIFGKPRPMKR